MAGTNTSQGLETACSEAASLFESLGRPPSSTRKHLPIGVGFQLFNTPPSDGSMALLRKYQPAGVWLFAPNHVDEIRRWTELVRQATEGQSRIWVQVGSVVEARDVVSSSSPDVLVVQGSDAGGHGLRQSASVLSLVPEILDMLEDVGMAHVPVLAAGGIVEGRGTAAALALGASGVVMGTRFLATEEAGIASGWKAEVLRNKDGGTSTIRSTLCDRLKETKGWPECYDGRAIQNQGHADEAAGMPDTENVRRFKEEARRGDEAWGYHGRMVAYAGTALGLINDIKPAASIVEEVSGAAQRILKRASEESRGGARSARL